MRNGVLLGIGLLIVGILSTWLWSQNWASIHFVDEEDNFAVGQLMLEGKNIYQDVFSHHQPLGYIISRDFQQVTDPNSIFSLVKYHRLLVVIWALFWWGLIIQITGYRGLILALVYEIIKYKYLGNVFLGESLSTYSLIYVLVLALREKAGKWQMFVAGVSLAIAWWLLASNALVVLVLGAYLFFKNNYRWWLIFGGLGVSVLTISQIPPTHYWQNAILVNLQIYIPTTQQNISLAWSNDIFWLVAAGTVMLNIFKMPILWWFVLLACTTRGLNLGAHYYSGFHFLPWIGIFLAGISGKVSKLALIVMLFLAVITNIGTLSPRDLANDFIVNYSQQAEMREVINTLKTDTDHLFVDPDEMLLFWKTTPSLNRYIFYYKWIEDSLSIDFGDKMPEFWYHQDRENQLEKYVQYYGRVKRKGVETDLYIHNTKIESLTPSQHQQLQYLGFEI